MFDTCSVKYQLEKYSIPKCHRYQEKNTHSVTEIIKLETDFLLYALSSNCMNSFLN